MRNSRVMLAATILCAGFGASAPPAPDRRTLTTQVRRKLDPHRYPVARDPFSSSRQHARAAARTYTITTRSGFEIMQTCRRGEWPSEAMERAIKKGLSVSKSFDGGTARSTPAMRADLRALRAGRVA